MIADEKNNKNESIVVSISCLTYNHASYIRQCLDAFIMQETNFKFEILIHDDASTDNTQSIISEYEQKYPDLIKPIYRRDNLYSKGIRFISRYNFNRAKGKYIAMCEGDDYWTDPYKLQKQVDFMELNPDYAIVYHNVKIFNESLKIFEPNKSEDLLKEKTYTVNDLASGNFIHTPSILFRYKSLDLDFLLEYQSVIIDYFIWMISSRSGKIKYLPDTMAVYRVWNGSIWALKDVDTKMYTWLPLLTSLLIIFREDKDVSNLLFIQLRNSYKKLLSSKIDFEKNLNLDKVTKTLLTTVNGFQSWWFAYMIDIKSSKAYRLKYFFYLVRKKSLNSSSLFWKCIY